MLSEGESALLEKINELCKEGGFKIAEEGELLSCFSKGGQKGELQRLLGDLEQRNYIEVKYAEEGVYCLRPLPEGRLYFEKLNEARREGMRRRGETFALSALGGFSGALLGTLLALLIFFLARGI